MIVSYKEAVKIFDKIPDAQKSLYLHPDYVILDAKAKGDVEPYFFAIMQDENIFYHAFQIGVVMDTSYKDIQSAYGYGGPICIGSQCFLRQVIDSYLTWCTENNVIVEFIRFHPLLKNHINYYGKVINNRQTIYIDLTVVDLLKSFSTRVRTAIRKSHKSGASVVFSKSPKYLSAYIKIYNSLMKEKGAGIDYFFSQEYYMKLLNNEYTHLVSVLNADKEIVGSAIFFTCGDIAEYHLSASNEEGKQLNASNLLLYEIAKFSKEKGYKKMYLGGGTTFKKEDSLLFFKKGFSKEMESFYIGNYIFNEKVYQQIKMNQINSKNNDINSEKILFYR